jgi:integrase
MQHGSSKLPPGVERVRVKGKAYYYWNPHRGTDREGERIPLPSADMAPADFWREVDKYQKAAPTQYPAFSIGALVTGFFDDDEVKKTLSESTLEGYAVHGNRFKTVWGLLPARTLRPAHVIALRDKRKDTPTHANHMLAFGRTLWNWGIPRDYSENNPFEKITDLETPDSGHVPWPKFVIDYVNVHAPEDLRRAARLGVMTCQRISDLIRMGQEHREKAGVWCRPKKTRKKRRSFLIPLAIADVLELDRWAGTPIVFTNPRWKQPRSQHNLDLYLYGPRGRAYTEDSLRARYHRWLDDTAEGRELCAQWQRWLAGQVRKYEWDIAPEDMKNPTIHGLRGTGILQRFSAGVSVDQLANDIGMSRKNVERYMRFKDQMEVAAAGQARLRLVEGVS